MSATRSRHQEYAHDQNTGYSNVPHCPMV